MGQEHKVIVYASGPLSCSACVKKGMSRAEIEAEVNRVHPAGTEHGWRISEDKVFRQGASNPCVCNTDPDRFHYLFEC